MEAMARTLKFAWRALVAKPAFPHRPSASPVCSFRAAISVCVALGTLLGSRVLARIPEIWFHRLLAAVLAALGISMVARGLFHNLLA